jgi:hypothetical protein
MTGEERSINGTYNRGMKFGFSLGKQLALKDVLKIIDCFFKDRIEWAKKPETKLNEALRFMYVQDNMNLKAQIEKELGEIEK